MHPHPPFASAATVVARGARAKVCHHFHQRSPTDVPSCLPSFCMFLHVSVFSCVPVPFLNFSVFTWNCAVMFLRAFYFPTLHIPTITMHPCIDLQFSACVCIVPYVPACVLLSCMLCVFYSSPVFYECMHGSAVFCVFLHLQIGLCISHHLAACFYHTISPMFLCFWLHDMHDVDTMHAYCA